MAGPKRKRTSTTANRSGGESDGEGDREAEFAAEEEYPEGKNGGETGTDGITQGECPFTVEYRQSKKPKGKKAKRHKTGMSTNTGPPPPQNLDQEPPEDTTVFTVKPKKRWDSLKKYRNFVVGSENFALNEYIFVNHSNLAHGSTLEETDEQKFWVARVLEIRAIDEAHVYLRIYWLYWPDELPGGRQPYHGAKELIASNHMEIVDAMTVSGRAHVKHWLELDEDEELPDLFWRQKFDFPTQTLMEVREHCKCHRYYNPDKLMYGCPHCKTWLHEECVQEDIKRKAYAKILAEEGEEAVRAAMAVLDVSAKGGRGGKAGKPQAPAPSDSAKKSKRTKGKSSGSGIAGGGGVGGGKKGKDAERYPTVEQLDRMFEVVITVSSDGQITRALVKDMRPKPKADGGPDEVEEEEEGEEVEEEVEDTEEEEAAEEDGEGEGDDEQAKKEKKKAAKKVVKTKTILVKRRKPRQTWEEDVLCLLCGQGIY